MLLASSMVEVTPQNVMSLIRPALPKAQGLLKPFAVLLGLRQLSSTS